MINLSRMGIVFLVSLQGTLASAQMVFDDGGAHTIVGDFQNELVTVSNSSSVTLQGNLSYVGDELNVNLVSVDGASFFLDGATLNSPSDGIPRKAISATNGSTLNINSGNIISTGLSSVDSELTVLGGSITSDYNFDLEVGSLLINGGSAKIIGGEVTAQGGASMTLFGSALGQVLGGTLTSSGGFPEAHGVRQYNDSNLVFTDGKIQVDGAEAPIGILLQDNAHMSMAGGELVVNSNQFGRGIFADEKSSVKIDSGTLRMQSQDQRPVTLFHASGDTKIDVLGGEFQVEDTVGDKHTAVVAQGNSRVMIAAGDFSAGPGYNVVVTDEAVLTIAGSGFNYPLFEPIVDEQGFLNGSLTDGQVISWEFDRSGAAQIILVPEPRGHLLLLGTVFAWIVRFRKSTR